MDIVITVGGFLLRAITVAIIMVGIKRTCEWVDTRNERKLETVKVNLPVKRSL